MLVMARNLPVIEVGSYPTGRKRRTGKYIFIPAGKGNEFPVSVPFSVMHEGSCLNMSNCLLPLLIYELSKTQRGPFMECVEHFLTEEGHDQRQRPTVANWTLENIFPEQDLADCTPYILQPAIMRMGERDSQAYGFVLGFVLLSDDGLREERHLRILPRRIQINNESSCEQRSIDS